MFGRATLSSKRLTTTMFKQHRRNFNTEKPFSKENLPFYGAAVGVTALCFQVLILYPWHEELSTQFMAIQAAIYHMEGFSKSLDTKMDQVMALEEQVKVKERKILLKEEEIFNMELKVVEQLERLTKAVEKVEN